LTSIFLSTTPVLSTDEMMPECTMPAYAINATCSCNSIKIPKREGFPMTA